MKRECKGIVLLTLFLFAAVGCSFAVDNPISYIGSVNDCDVIKCNGEYYLSGNWLGGDMIRSRDLENWGNRTHIFSYTNTWHTPKNGDLDIHGTHLRYDNGVYHLYAHLDCVSPETVSITHATSSTVLGPYSELTPPSPFAANIDAGTFMDEDGSFYFYDVWFNSGNQIRGRSMANLSSLSGSWNNLLFANGGWEGTTWINEAPKVFKYRGRYYMLYNAYETSDSRYSIGCAEASSPLGFTNSGKYGAPVLTRVTPPSGGEINTIGQAWVVDGVNGFEKWLGYFAVAAGRRDQCIDRIHFFNKKLFVDGPTNRYSTGYHPGPAKPQLLSLFNSGSGAMPAEDWTPVSAGTWGVSDYQARQLDQSSFSLTTVHRNSSVNYLFEANVKFTEARDAEDKCGVVAYYKDSNNWMIVGLDRSLYPGGSADNWYCHKKENGVDTVVAGGYAGSVNYGVYHKFRIEKNGSSFKIRIDDKIPPGHSGTVSTLFSAAGIPGLYTDHAAAAFDGAIYTVGWDEYDGGVQGWAGTDGGVPAAGNWTYAADGIAQSLTSGLHYIFKGDLMPEYEFSAQVTKSGSAEGSMGIMPVVIDTANYLSAEINLVTDKLVVYGAQNGVSIPNQEAAVANLSTYNLRAVKLSDRIILFVDGQEKLTVNQSFGPSQVGLINQNMAAAYDGILVYQTEPENTAPWMTADVGTVGFAGSADLREGTFFISGSGADIWDLNDGFRFVYRPWNGDGEIIAKVDSIDPTDWWAKAGVMFRQNFSSNSAMVFMAVNAGAGKGGSHQLIWRNGPGFGTGIANHDQADLIPSTSWLKLRRQGSTLSGWYSQEGTNWTFLGSTNSVGLSAACYAGLAVTSHSNTRTCGAVFDHVSTRQCTIASPQGDINSDCLVNLEDVEVLAAQWLSSGDVPSANIYADARVDLADFALLAQHWLSCGWIPESLCP